MKKIFLIALVSGSLGANAQIAPQPDPNAGNANSQQWQTSGGIMATSTEASNNVGPEGSGEPGTNDVPLDGGISALLVAGIGYGVSRRNARKTK